MASFVVMERASGARPAPDGASSEMLMVRDGFHVLAFLLPVVWMLWHRLWIEALVAAAVTLGLGALVNYAGAGAAGAWASLLVSLFIGLEAPSARLAALRRRGWRDWGVVEAADAGEAETRYLAEAVREVGGDASFQPSARPVSPARPSSALGLFAYPGAR